MTDDRQRLPLRLRQTFRPWAYQISHRRLVLGSGRRDEPGGLAVEFLDVVAMQIRHRYEELVIRDAGREAAIEDFADIPERHDARFLRLIVADGPREGFVVCGSLRLHATDSPALASPGWR